MVGIGRDIGCAAAAGDTYGGCIAATCIVIGDTLLRGVARIRAAESRGTAGVIFAGIHAELAITQGDAG